MQIRKVELGEIIGMLPLGKIRDFKPDAILAVERGGLIPGAIIARELAIPLVSARASLYNDEKPAKKIHPSPVVDLRALSLLGKRVLIVDDVSNSGATLFAVKSAALSAGASAAETYCLFGKSNLSDVPFEGCVRFPWEI